MQDEDLKSLIEEVNRILLKAIESTAILRDGKSVIAHEKMGGVCKNLSALYGKLCAYQREHSSTESV